MLTFDFQANYTFLTVLHGQQLPLADIEYLQAERNYTVLHLADAPLPPPPQTLKVAADELVFLDEITHLTANGNYTYIHVRDGRRYFLSKTMRYFERLLSPSYFFRPDKSCIVNLLYVTAIQRNFIEVTHQHQLPISRRKWREVKKEYLIKMPCCQPLGIGKF